MVRTRARRTRQLLGVVLASACTVGWTLPTAAASRATDRPPNLGSPLAVGVDTSGARNPAHNLPPNPDYLETCAAEGWRNTTCTAEVLVAIARARSHEGVKKAAMVLPDNYSKLSVAEQTFVVTDLERVARGLKPFRGLTPSLNDASRAAALLRLDPTPATSLLRLLGIYEYGSVWAGDYGPLASDYDWMYNDGYSQSGSINLDCLTPQDVGCWGHRENILGTYHHRPTLLAGAGTGHPAGESIAEVLTGGTGPAPKFTYTWKQAVKHGATNSRP